MLLLCFPQSVALCLFWHCFLDHRCFAYVSAVFFFLISVVTCRFFVFFLFPFFFCRVFVCVCFASVVVFSLFYVCMCVCRLFRCFFAFLCVCFVSVICCRFFCVFFCSLRFFGLCVCVCVFCRFFFVFPGYFILIFLLFLTFPFLSRVFSIAISNSLHVRHAQQPVFQAHVCARLRGGGYILRHSHQKATGVGGGRARYSSGESKNLYMFFFRFVFFGHRVVSASTLVQRF